MSRTIAARLFAAAALAALAAAAPGSAQQGEPAVGAQELASLGAEVVHADLDDLESLQLRWTRGFIELGEIFSVGFRQYDSCNASTMGRQYFLAYASDWQYEPRQRDFSGHSDIAANWPPS